MSLQDLQKAYPFPKDPPAVPELDHGWFGPDQIDLLSGAMGPNVKVIVELGSWMGKSTLYLASKSPNAVVISIDHWLGSPEHHASPDWSLLIPRLYETFLKNCWAYKDRIVPLRMDTVSGLTLVHKHGIRPDLIFIDAGHEYVSVNADISTALALFPDSPLCGDDYPWDGVNRSVREHVRSSAMRAMFKHPVWWKENPVFTRIQGAAKVQ